MKLPYEITSEILKLISKISRKIGEVDARRLIKHDPHLRKLNRLKTIQSSLGIEDDRMKFHISAAYMKPLILDVSMMRDPPPAD